MAHHPTPFVYTKFKGSKVPLNVVHDFLPSARRPWLVFGIHVSSKASHVLTIKLQRSLTQEYPALASTHKASKLSPMTDPSGAKKVLQNRGCLRTSSRS